MAKHQYWMAALLMVAGLQLAGCAAKPPAAAAEKPSHVDPIEGSKLKKVTLTEKAKTRLDIQTTAMLEEQVTRKRRVGGEVVATMGSAPANGSLWVRVNMTDGDLSRIDNSQPIRVLPIDGSDDDDGVEAEVEADDMGDEEEAGGAKVVYYAVRGKDHALQPGQRMLVELTLKSDSKARKSIPYSAIIYDVKGETWVYMSSEPLVFVRAPVTIDYIVDQTVYLTEGPAAGTQIVINGVAELYGAETGVGK